MEMIRELFKRLRMLFGILRKEHNKHALSHVLRNLKQILGRLAPKNGGGYIQFGSGDPYSTGRIMEAAAFLYPLYGDKIEVTPLFDRAELKTDLDVRGRFCLAQVVFPLLGLLMDKDVRRALRELRELSEP